MHAVAEITRTDTLLTSNEAAERASCAPLTIRIAAYKCDLAHRLVGGRMVFAATDVDAWAKARAEKKGDRSRSARPRSLSTTISRTG